MKLLKIALASSAILAVAACSPKVPEPKMEVENLEVSEKVNREDLEHKLDFDKDILFIQIDEVSEDALHERPMGGISSQDSYVKDGKELYMFYDAEIPTEDTNMIIMEESIGSFDYQLSHKLRQTDKNTLKWKNEEIDNEHVNNENRLFLNDEISVSELKDGEVNVSVGNKSLNVKPGSEDSIKLKDGDIESEFIVTNYGYLNSIKDMTYERLLEEDEARLPDELKETKAGASLGVASTATKGVIAGANLGVAGAAAQGVVALGSTQHLIDNAESKDNLAVGAGVGVVSAISKAGLGANLGDSIKKIEGEKAGAGLTNLGSVSKLKKSNIAK